MFITITFCLAVLLFSSLCFLPFKLRLLSIISCTCSKIKEHNFKVGGKRFIRDLKNNLFLHRVVRICSKLALIINKKDNFVNIHSFVLNFPLITEAHPFFHIFDSFDEGSSTFYLCFSSHWGPSKYFQHFLLLIQISSICRFLIFHNLLLHL